jgi:hypothetical protein
MLRGGGDLCLLKPISAHPGPVRHITRLQGLDFQGLMEGVTEGADRIALSAWAGKERASGRPDPKRCVASNRQ